MRMDDLLNVGSGILNDVTRAVETGNYEGLGERTRERVAFAVTQMGEVPTAPRPPVPNIGEVLDTVGSLSPTIPKPPVPNIGRLINTVGSMASTMQGTAQAPGKAATENPGAASGARSEDRSGTSHRSDSTSALRGQTARSRVQPYSYAGGGSQSYFLRKPPSALTGVPQIAVGALAGLVSGLQLVRGILGTLSLAVGGVAPGMGFTAFFLVLFLVSMGILWSGLQARKLVRRYYEVGAAAGNAEYFDLESLASKVGSSVKVLTADLERMMRQGFLPGARLDRRKTTLMLTERAYEQYQAAEQGRVEREAAAQLRGEPRVEVARGADSEVRQIIDEGNRAIAQVRAVNDEIPDAVMSDKLYRLEEIMKRIFEQVQKDPSTASDLRRFMSYYLPTTQKLLSAYVELDRQPLQSANIRQTKQEIQGSLDTINEAFAQLLDGMFEDMALDISTDISVMKTMMAQDGLAKGDKRF